MHIVMAGEDAVVRRGIEQILAGEPGWRVVAEVDDAEEVLPVLHTTPADLLILDVDLRGRGTLALLGTLRAAFPSLPILMLSAYAEEQYAIPCIRAGATGYVQKDSAPNALLDTIRRIATRTHPTGSTILDQLAAELAYGTTGRPQERLSARELEVFRLIAKGLTVTQIARLLRLSVKTISTFRTRALRKAGFRSNAEVIAYAIRTGMV